MATPPVGVAVAGPKSEGEGAEKFCKARGPFYLNSL